MGFHRNPLLRSLLVHGFLVGLIAYRITGDPFQVRGSDGLAGRTQTHFDVTISQPAPEKITADVPVAPVRVGLELPSEVKNEKPRVIESAGTTEAPEKGNQGQAGSSDTIATQIGNSDRTNAEGLYLLKLQRKIQENLESAGYIDFDRKTLLQFLVRKDGLIENIKVLTSSGDRTLDLKAIRAVEKVRTFLERPDDLPVQVPVLFRATR